MLLSACDLLNSLTGSQSATPTVPPSQVYTGSDFSLTYPHDWSVKEGAGQVTFSDALGISRFQVQVIPNPGGVVTPSRGVDEALNVFKGQVKNYKKEGTSTTAVAREQWQQGEATGDYPVNGQTVNVRFITIATNHPKAGIDTKLFVIFYTTGTQIFDTTNSSSFQPMLQSFKFAH